MKLLDEYILQLVPREPIFSVYPGRLSHISLKNDEIVYQPLSQHPDPVARLLESLSEDVFDANKAEFVFNSSGIKKRMCLAIVRSFQGIYWRCSGHAKPKLSKTYKWLNNKSSNLQEEIMNETELGNGLVMLYRYLHQKADGVRVINDTDKTDPNVQNAILILEAMRQKYDN